jgi:hypothetical protein
MGKDIRVSFTIPLLTVKQSMENGKISLTSLVHTMNRTDCTEDEKSFKSDVMKYIKAIEDLLMLLKDPDE